MRRIRSLLTILTPALALAAAADPAAAQTLERRPYLQMVTPTSATVVWTTTAGTDTRLRYGSSPSSLTSAVELPSAVTQHEVKLTGLAPATRYYYSVGTTSSTLAGGDDTHWFETAPAVGTPKKFRAWVLGDSGYNAQVVWDVRDAMLRYVGAYGPHMLLHVGDMAYNSGTAAEFTSNFFGNFHQTLRNTVTWPAFGNHEGLSASSASQTGPYYAAYVIPTQGEAGGLASGTEAYYSFDYANVHFVVLNSYDVSRAPNGAMLTWLQADLAATNQEWLIAYWHHPPYSKGSHDSDTDLAEIEMRQNALPILEAAGVDLVLAGHSHIYERSYLVDGAYDTPTTAAGHIVDSGDGRTLGSGPYRKLAGLSDHDGAVYVVAGHAGYTGGPGGHPLMYFTETRSGSCLLDVQGNRLSVVNVRSDDQVSDRFSIIKGAGLVVGAPDGGERINQGGAYTIRWATSGSIPAVNLEYSADDGATWSTIAQGVANTGQYAWTAPQASTSRGLVRVSDAADPAVFDESNMGFSVQAPVQTAIQLGDYWTYDDRGIDHGAAWLSASFDDTDWEAGYAHLGYGDGDEDTVVYKASPDAYPSAYFRKIIPVSGQVTAATLKAVYDDGVIVWINGVQVFSKYVGSTAYSAYAVSGGPDNETTTVNLPLANNPFVEGSNVVAVMVKQVAPASNDLSFDLELTLTVEGGSAGGGDDGGGSGSSSSSSSATTSSSSDATTTTGAGGSGGAGGAGGAGGEAGTGDPCTDNMPMCMVVKRGSFGTVADATVWQSSPNYKDGTGTSLYTGVSSGALRHALLRFDLGFISTGAPVCSAILKVTQGWKSTSSTVRVHQVLVPWTETTATWNLLAGGWSSATLGSFTASSGSGDRSVDVLDQVQAWVDGTPNHGFLLEEDAITQTALYASEYSNPDRYPRLEVCFIP